MNVTFLGTGTSQGVPVIGCYCEVCRSPDPKDARLRTSAHVEVNGVSIVLDTGPDFRMQMLRNGIARLDALLYTHAHRDHTAGLDDIRPFCFMKQQPIPLYATERVLMQIRSDFAYVFAENKYPGAPEITTHLIDGTPFLVQGQPVVPLEALHGKLPVLGFRIGNFSYLTDASFLPEATFAKLEGTEVLVLNALRHAPHPSHFTLSQALQVAERVGAKATYFTHLSHYIGRHETVQPTLPEGVFLAYDGLRVSLAE